MMYSNVPLMLILLRINPLHCIVCCIYALCVQDQGIIKTILYQSSCFLFPKHTQIVSVIIIMIIIREKQIHGAPSWLHLLFQGN